jgi:ribosomal protein L11 methyltransferase
MSMVELRLLVPAARVDTVSDALIEDGDALSVSVEDADAGSAGEQALYGEPGMAPPEGGWQRSVLTALFADADAAELAASALLTQEAAHGVQQLSLGPLAEQDWVRLTQAQFQPAEIAPGFWISPSWHEPPAGAQRVIRLDPGMAFGTGSHPTTRMCLRWIARQAAVRSAGWSRVLDYGCGSGILAIAAALHGAAAVDAVDIDPDAVAASAANARHNQAAAVRSALPDAAQGRYELVLANILATPLKLLAPLLAGYVESGGDLVLAGILERQTAELQQAYRPWLELQADDHEDGWVLLTGRRR